MLQWPWIRQGQPDCLYFLSFFLLYIIHKIIYKKKFLIKKGNQQNMSKTVCSPKSAIKVSTFESWFWLNGERKKKRDFGLYT